MPISYYLDASTGAGTTDWATIQFPRQWNHQQCLRALRAFPLQKVILETASPLGDTQLDCVGFFWAQMEDNVIFPLMEPELYGDYEALCWDGILPMDRIEDIYFSYVPSAANAPMRLYGVFE